MATQSNAERASTKGEHSAEHAGGKPKDWLGRLLAALVAAALTGWVTWTVNRNEMRARSVELQSGREVAVQALQGQVFDSFAAHVAPVLEKKENDAEKVVLLAALHSNFSEFFDMRPVLEIFASSIEDLTARHELMRLAKRVARRQARYIKAHPGKKKEDGPMSETVTLFWSSTTEKQEEFVKVGPHKVNVYIKSKPVRHYELNELDPEYNNVAARYRDVDDGIMDDVVDQVEVAITLGNAETEHFTVSYMDSPYMDNYWMVHDDLTIGRLAVVLKDIDKEGEDEYKIELELLHFPGDLFTPTERPPAAQFDQPLW